MGNHDAAFFLGFGPFLTKYQGNTVVDSLFDRTFMHLTSASFIPPNSGILEEEVDDFDNSATIKAKNFFHSCMDMSKQE